MNDDSFVESASAKADRAIRSKSSPETGSGLSASIAGAPLHKPSYRVWDNEQRKFFEPTYRAYQGQLEELLLSPSGEVLMRTMTQLIHCPSLMPGRFIVNLKTGLKDEEDIEIYEGNVYRVEWTAELGVTELDCECRMVVRYDVETASFRLFPAVPYVRDVDFGGEEPGRYEVVSMELSQEAILSDEFGYSLTYLGTIYENPELLNS